MCMDNNHEVGIFLEKNFPQSDSILLGCRADANINVHECCEYNIIAINDSQLSSQRIRFFNIPSDKKGNDNKTFLVRVLSTKEIHRNNLIRYSDFKYYPGKYFKFSDSNPFRDLHEKCHRSFGFRLKTEIFGNIFDLTRMLNSLSRNSITEKTISFEIKMMSLRTLRNYIHIYLRKEHRPSHLKYQINSVIQNESMKVRERIDLILETIGTHRFNISALNRSETSLKLLLGNIHSPTKKLVLEKIQFLKEKSMYVDGILLIYNYILDNFQTIEQKLSYQHLLNRTTDIDNKEKLTLIKQINFLLESNKLLI